MDVYNYPIPFCIIKDCFTEDRVNDIKKELQSLRNNLNTVEKTASAKSENGNLLARRRGIFLQEHKDLCKNSQILEIQNDIRMLHKYKDKAWYMNYFVNPNILKTLVSLFEDGDEYKYHYDIGVLSIIYYIFEGEFEGGDFYLAGVKVPIEHNSMIVFPSCAEHMVTPIKGSGSRWSITNFLHIASEPVNIQMSNPVKRIPNFLDEMDVKRMKEEIQNFSWKLTGRSGDSIKGGDNAFFWYSELKDNAFFSEHIFNKIPDGPWTLQRVYANGQSYGQNGDFHVDSVEPDTATFLLYTNEIKPEHIISWNGKTEFDMGNTITSELPIFNTGILFPSGISHRGLAPARYTNDIRITIAWKLKKKNIV